MTINLIRTLLVLLLITFGPAVNATDCPTCPSAANIENISKRLAQALTNKAENIVLARMLSEDETSNSIRSGIFNSAELDKLLNSAYGIDLFEVADHIKGTTKYLAYFSQFIVTAPSPENPTGTSFFPADNSKWILIIPISDSAIGKSLIRSNDWSQITLSDPINGVIPVGVKNGLGVNTEELFEDLKIISKLLSSPNLKQMPSLKTGLGSEVFRNIAK